MTTPRISPQTGLLLQALLEEPAQWRYGYDLSQQIGLKSGTLYPILMRLAKHSLLETRWEGPTNSGRPPRHMYRLTGAGQRVAREERRTTPRRARLKQAYGER